MLQAKLNVRINIFDWKKSDKLRRRLLTSKLWFRYPLRYFGFPPSLFNQQHIVAQTPVWRNSKAIVSISTYVWFALAFLGDEKPRCICSLPNSSRIFLVQKNGNVSNCGRPRDSGECFSCNSTEKKQSNTDCYYWIMLRKYTTWGYDLLSFYYISPAPSTSPPCTCTRTFAFLWLDSVRSVKFSGNFVFLQISWLRNLSFAFWYQCADIALKLLCHSAWLFGTPTRALLSPLPLLLVFAFSFHASPSSTFGFCFLHFFSSDESFITSFYQRVEESRRAF